MGMVYHRLFVLMARLGLKKTDLIENKVMTSPTLAKLSKGESITTEVLCRICQYLHCQPWDIMEYEFEKQKEIYSPLNTKYSFVLIGNHWPSGISQQMSFQEILETITPAQNGIIIPQQNEHTLSYLITFVVNIDVLRELARHEYIYVTQKIGRNDETWGSMYLVPGNDDDMVYVLSDCIGIFGEDMVLHGYFKPTTD